MGYSHICRPELRNFYVIALCYMLTHLEKLVGPKVASNQDFSSEQLLISLFKGIYLKICALSSI